MSDKELMTLSASEQDECRQYIAWTTGGPEPDWKNMATWLVKCADNRKQNAALRETIARLEREKGLLVAVANGAREMKQMEELAMARTGEFCYIEPFSEWDELHDKIMDAVQAAIDGGALE